MARDNYRNRPPPDTYVVARRIAFNVGNSDGFGVIPSDSIRDAADRFDAGMCVVMTRMLINATYLLAHFFTLPNIHEAESSRGRKPRLTNGPEWDLTHLPSRQSSGARLYRAESDKSPGRQGEALAARFSI
jgi:hypothetical protein